MTLPEPLADEAPDQTSVIDESTTDDATLIELPDSTLDYFGADFDMAGLVRRLNDGDIVIPRYDADDEEDLDTEIDPFQRANVWTPARMETFIETLLLGWPVPSIFLVVESDERYLVLDGQQRLTALQCFYRGEYRNGKEFKLQNVARHLKGKTYADLSRPEKRRLDNMFIQATVVQPRGKDGPQSVYSLFGRLNSGGVALAAQEVRVALYMGPATDWIRRLNKNADWRALFGRKSARLKDHELILRSLALRESLARMRQDWDVDSTQFDGYTPPMAGFLNNYLGDNRKLQNVDTESLGAAFAEACNLLYSADDRALRYTTSLNAAHVDAVVASLMQLCLDNASPSIDTVESALSALRSSPQYRDVITRSTSHRDSVRERLRLAYLAMKGDDLA
ncbi:DUF262 domain-containing protein [Streptomyces anulatus]|uniref:DUF262 domain-containing protein n=1 Tax=Streptomyces TaxID=1883 RepID=UPI001C5D1359|nr:MULTISPECIES: DUF262 domain-containing protein [Streptomyces]QYA95344.1 DUF262 domain-containing protein [Streptomyces anulatus]